MGGTCGTRWGGERCLQGGPKVGDHWEDLDVGGG